MTAERNKPNYSFFIATTFRGCEEKAMSEIRKTFLKADTNILKISKTASPGLLVGTAENSISEIIPDLRRIIEEEPWQIRYILRIVPLELIVNSLDRLPEQIKRLTARIPPDSSFRVTVEKRNSTIDSNDLIRNVAKIVLNPVDLDNPKWIIMIQIIGKWVALGVLEPREILSVVRIKRGD